MNSNTLFRRYIWLVDAIYSAGSISLADLQARWLNASINDDGSELDRRTFHRYREAIEDIWGVEVVCDHATNRYSLTNLGDLGSGNAAQTWMADSFAIQNMITHTRNLRERVLFEPIPAGTRYLSLIVSAMSELRQLRITYRRFDAQAHTFLIKPFCIKAFKQRWYLVGKPDDHPEEIGPRVYALDRIQDLELTEQPYSMPADFEPGSYFRGYYGIDRREQPTDIRIRVKAEAANYLRSLPLHESQREISVMSDCSDFQLHISPTYDFIQELRKHGPNLEVLSPEWLRQKMAEDAKLMADIYGR